MRIAPSHRIPARHAKNSRALPLAAGASRFVADRARRDPRPKRVRPHRRARHRGSGQGLRFRRRRRAGRSHRGGRSGGHGDPGRCHRDRRLRQSRARRIRRCLRHRRPACRPRAEAAVRRRDLRPGDSGARAFGRRDGPGGPSREGRARRDARHRKARGARRRRRGAAPAGIRRRRRRAGDRSPARPGSDREPGRRAAVGPGAGSFERPDRGDARPRRERLSDFEHGRRGGHPPGVSRRALVARRGGGVCREPGRPRSPALHGGDGGARAGGGREGDRRLRDDRRALAPAGRARRARAQAPGPVRGGRGRVPAHAGGGGGEARSRPARRVSSAGQAGSGRGVARRLDHPPARVRPCAGQSAVAS